MILPFHPTSSHASCIASYILPQPFSFYKILFAVLAYCIISYISPVEPITYPTLNIPGVISHPTSSYHVIHHTSSTHSTSNPNCRTSYYSLSCPTTCTQCMMHAVRYDGKVGSYHLGLIAILPYPTTSYHHTLNILHIQHLYRTPGC